MATFIAFETYTIETEGIALDLLIWRRFKRPMFGLLEQTYALPENVHVAQLLMELPVGTIVTIPVPQERTTDQIQVVDLFT